MAGSFCAAVVLCVLHDIYSRSGGDHAADVQQFSNILKLLGTNIRKLLQKTVIQKKSSSIVSMNCL